jgi:dTDP-glucose pyrophosphorylase
VDSVLNYKVLITTSGIGSRLGELTSYTNKSLLPIGNKASLSWIVESYPANTNFVVTLGYFGEHVMEYLQIAHPDRKFEFVEVENFQGEGSSLGLSMLEAEPLLQLPFIYHASDTVIADTVIPEPTEDWVMGYRSEEATSYVSFDSSSGSVTNFHPKGWDNYDFLHIGLIGVKSFEKFWECLRECVNTNPSSHETNDVSALMRMLKSGNRIRVQVAHKWFDLGNIGSLNMARKQIPDKFCILEKNGESIFFVNNNVIKFFADSQICQKRVERAKVLKDIVPAISADSKYFYVYPFVSGKNASFRMPAGRVSTIMKWAESKLWLKKDILDLSNFRDLCSQFYVTKTQERLNRFLDKNGLVDEVIHVNGKKTPRVFHLLEKIDHKFLGEGIQSRIHGDFILDNLIIHGEEIKAIDWRQDFAGNILVGDLYYDLAKLMHSFYVNHEVVEKSLFSIDYEESNEKSVHVDILRSNSLIKAEEEFIHEIMLRGYSLKRIQVLTALVWLNMAALHHRPFDVFLYLFGKSKLAEALGDVVYD